VEKRAGKRKHARKTVMMKAFDPEKEDEVEDDVDNDVEDEDEDDDREL